MSWKFILQPVYQTTLYFSWHRYGQLSGVVEPIAGLLGTIAVVVSAHHMVLDSEVCFAASLFLVTWQPYKSKAQLYSADLFELPGVF